MVSAPFGMGLLETPPLLHVTLQADGCYTVSNSLIYTGSDNFGPGYAVTQAELSPVQVLIAPISIVLDLLQCIRKLVNGVYYSLISSCRDDGSGLNNFTGDDEEAEGHETLLRYEAPTTHTQKVVPPPVAPKPVLKSQPVQDESDDDTFNDIDIPDLGDK